MLRSLPGKEEVNGFGVVRVETSLHTLTVSLREHLNRVRNIAHHDGAAVRGFATTGPQNSRNVRDAHRGMGFQVFNEIVRRPFNSFLPGGGQYEQLCKASRVARELRG